jgi:hypothetical protein
VIVDPDVAVGEQVGEGSGPSTDPSEVDISRRLVPGNPNCALPYPSHRIAMTQRECDISGMWAGVVADIDLNHPLSSFYLIISTTYEKIIFMHGNSCISCNNLAPLARAFITLPPISFQNYRVHCSASGVKCLICFCRKSAEML